jgi:signal transduction histidine kinase
MKDYKQRELWGKISGEPVYNDRNQVVGIVGLFQDITSEKEQELHLKQSVAHLKNQNEGLQVFTKITSHNLRSLANNLQLSLELLRESQSKEEQEELMEGLGHISESFNTTIQHLNSMLSIQTKAKAERQNVAFREVMESVLHTEHPLILETDAEVYSDFSEMPTIPYHTDYLEFILRELLVNALKFRHPRRKPEINIYSSIENDTPMLTVKDNGLGIDLEKHGERLFQLYQTFHDDPAASGTGLFLVRTKVEAMLGTIKVSSEPDKGTIFRIEF